MAGRKLNPSILREYDIRGTVGQTFDKADVEAIGRGFASVARERVGRGYAFFHPRDTRGWIERELAKRVTN